MPTALRVSHKAVGLEVRRGPYDIVLDGEKIGSVGMNETFETPTEPGRHTLQVRNGRYSSRTRAFDAEEDGVASFRCSGKGTVRIPGVGAVAFLLSFVSPGLALSLHRE